MRCACESCAAPKACTPWGGRWKSVAESTTYGGRRCVATNARRTRAATTSGTKVPRVLPQICQRRQQRARGSGAPARGVSWKRGASPIILHLPAPATLRSVRPLRSTPQHRTAHARSPKPQRFALAKPLLRGARAADLSLASLGHGEHKPTAFEKAKRQDRSSMGQ